MRSKGQAAALTPVRRRGLTSVEARIDRAARSWLRGRPHHTDRSRRIRSVLLECIVFLLKQAWACIFGALLLVAIVVTRLWYPDDAALSRNDALTLFAIGVQILMLLLRLESGKELWVIVLFHLSGTVMELFKTDIGSWTYAGDGVLRIAGVPLFSGFMYGAVGSYMVRVMRLHELTFSHYPRVWLTSVVAVLVYVNFFSHHFVVDLRWFLVAAVVALWWRTVMVARIWRTRIRLPLLLVFAGVALFIWVAENIATWGGAWLYPSQVNGWEPVSWQKIVSWFLLMILSVVMVTWVYPPRTPEEVPLEATASDE